MATLKEIRAKLQASSQQTGGGMGGDNAIYPHWNILDGQTVTIRFLPDRDPNNTFFWIERNLIKLPFSGVKGEASSKSVTVQVPCMEMWGETCPILTEVRPWFKDKSLEEMGRKYWKKKSYLFQGFVVDSKYQEDGKVPENPIRRFIMGTQIFNIIKSALMDPEMDETPTDYMRGLDFRIAKTSKGGYADYSTSNWARRERALSEEELAAIDQYGLFDLKEFLPKKPTETELKIMKEMFEASVDGEAFDMDSWGRYFKPSGYTSGESSNGASSQSANTLADESATATPAPVTKAATSKVVEIEEDEPSDASSASSASSKAQDILAMIRSRQKQS
jgi:hypothetical protein